MTANLLDTIPAALRDRLEVIHMGGYTHEEKLSIAKDHLVSRSIEGTGLRASQLRFTSAGLSRIIESHTREAGLRELERNILKICRKVAKRYVEGSKKRVCVGKRKVREMLGEGSIRCSINPETGQETIYPEGPAGESKEVWVVGAGPGGLMAACEADRLGHRVSLFEKENELGGQMRFGSVPPHKKIYGQWIRWQIDQAKKRKMIIKTNLEVTDTMVKDHRPQHVILAVGAEKIMPDAIPHRTPYIPRSVILGR